LIDRLEAVVQRYRQIQSELARPEVLADHEQLARLGREAKTLEDIRSRAKLPVYVSLDIDSVDPAFAPGTGTPEVAGLTSREIVDLVRGLKGLPLAGFDVVEVAPAYDTAEITALLAANLVYEFLLGLPEAKS